VPIVAGRVIGPHGLSGQLRVRCGGEAEAALLRASRVRLLQGPEEEDGIAFPVRAARSGRRGEVRLSLEGVEGRLAAEELAGRLVALDAAWLEAPGPDEYYAHQLVGCRVERQDGSAVGRVSGIWPTAGADLLVVAGAGGAEHLVPLARDLLLEVDLDGRRIVIDAIPGLVDAERS
jgi:16S rRNA processing protein RimM